MRYSIRVLVLLFFIVFAAFKQGNNHKEKAVKGLETYYQIYDQNPSELNESNLITQLLHKSINFYLNGGTGKERLKLKCDIFKSLDKSAYSYYSDTQEERRMVLRRGACFVSLALLSECDKSFTYLKYAKNEFIDSCKTEIVTEFTEEQYISVLLFELYLKEKEGSLAKKDIEEVKRVFENSKVNVSEEFINESTSLLDSYMASLGL